MELFLMIASMLGGLALFLYGMNVMSDTLSQMAGGGLDRALGKITKNRFSAFQADLPETGLAILSGRFVEHAVFEEKPLGIGARIVRQHLLDLVAIGSDRLSVGLAGRQDQQETGKQEWSEQGFHGDQSWEYLR